MIISIQTVQVQTDPSNPIIVNIDCFYDTVTQGDSDCDVKYIVNINYHHLGDNCIQNFHLGRYIFGYTVGNLVLQRRASGAVKRDFRTYIRRYTSQNENFEYGYPHSNALLQFCLKLDPCEPHKAARHPTKGDVIDDVKLFSTVYCRIYCRKSLTLSNQTSRYKRKCIRIDLVLTQIYPALKKVWNQIQPINRELDFGILYLTSLS